LVPVHTKIASVQASAAKERGRALFGPELAGDAEMWEQAVDHGSSVREWLKQLGQKGVAIPAFPSELGTLRGSVLRTIRGGLEGGPSKPTPGHLSVFPKPAPGQYRIDGELDIGTVDQLDAVCRFDLDDGHPLRLDVAGVRFVDSQGLRLLIRLGGLTLERGLAPMVLTRPSRAVYRLLKLAVPRGIPGVQVIDVVGEDFDGPPR
jgi:anti-anti-sigma factor